MNSYDMSEQMAEILTSLVLSAYECVLQGADDRTVYQAFSCFSDEQLERIIGIARRQ